MFRTAEGSPYKTHGITLIALIITIILLLILAGVTIHFTLGKNGILKNAEIARSNYKQSEENETQTLNEVNRYITNRGNISNIQSNPSGFNPNIMIDEHLVKNEQFADSLTSMQMAGTSTISKDLENKIDEYIEYSAETGYTVKKNGWYFIGLRINIQGNTVAKSRLEFCMDGCNDVIYRISSDHFEQTGAITVYLNEGQKFYFKATGIEASATRRVFETWVYPM